MKRLRSILTKCSFFLALASLAAPAFASLAVQMHFAFADHHQADRAHLHHHVIEHHATEHHGINHHGTEHQDHWPKANLEISTGNPHMHEVPDSVPAVLTKQGPTDKLNSEDTTSTSLRHSPRVPGVTYLRPAAAPPPLLSPQLLPYLHCALLL